MVKEGKGDDHSHPAMLRTMLGLRSHTTTYSAPLFSRAFSALEKQSTCTEAHSHAHICQAKRSHVMKHRMQAGTHGNKELGLRKRMLKMLFPDFEFVLKSPTKVSWQGLPWCYVRPLVCTCTLCVCKPNAKRASSVAHAHCTVSLIATSHASSDHLASSNHCTE